MVKKNSVACKNIVRFTIVHSYPIPIKLCNSIGTSRIKGSCFSLWNSLDLAKQFACGCIVKFGYRYQYRKDIFFKGIANFGFDYNASGKELPLGHKIIWGYGAGVEFLTPVGPIQLLVANGEKSVLKPGNKNLFGYLTAGYKF